MKILIVDDECTNRMILAELLKSYGEPDLVENGVEAIRAARIAIENGVPYDLIFLDIMMPGTDGHAALIAIRSVEKRYGLTKIKRSKILMTTALNDRMHILNAIKEDCDSYIVKPIDQSKLTDCLRQVKLIA
jgi:two-component system, chemotaxis family, chemotaxis protein CheY